jgi:hypothetical protein
MSLCFIAVCPEGAKRAAMAQLPNDSAKPAPIFCGLHKSIEIKRLHSRPL